MIGRRKILFLPGLFTIALVGCSSPQTLHVENPELDTIKRQFIKSHQQIARKYESENALNQARREWKIIDAIQLPETSLAPIEIARLERVAALRIKQHLEAAHTAEMKSDYKTAQLEFLKALALQPDNARAVNGLKSMVGRRSYANLALAPEVSDAIDNPVDVYIDPDVYAENGKVNSKFVSKIGGKSLQLPGNETVYKNLQKTEINGSANNIQRGLAHLSRKEYKHAVQYFLIAQKKGEESQEIVDEYLEKAYQALAKQHYNKGVIAFRAGLYDKAVKQFEQALDFVPDHQKAHFYLSSAKALQ